MMTTFQVLTDLWNDRSPAWLIVVYATFVYTFAFLARGLRSADRVLRPVGSDIRVGACFAAGRPGKQLLVQRTCCSICCCC